jgi:hypothetical protein
LGVFLSSFLSYDIFPEIVKNNPLHKHHPSGCFYIFVFRRTTSCRILPVKHFIFKKGSEYVIICNKATTEEAKDG